MLEQKIVITQSEHEINNLLNEGWVVISVTAQYIEGFSYGAEGNFCFVLQRTKTN